MQPRAGGGLGALPVAPASLPPAVSARPGGTSSSWLWRAGLVPSLGQARPGSPGGRGTRLQPVAVYYAIHLYFGVFNHSGQKAPPTLWSLQGRLTGTVSPGSTRPSAQLHWPAVRPAPLGRGHGAPSAPRGWMPCLPGRFLHSTLLFLLSQDFPPRLLNKHCFSALARFAGWRVKERVGWRGLGEPRSACPRERGRAGRCPGCPRAQPGTPLSPGGLAASHGRSDCWGAEWGAPHRTQPTKGRAAVPPGGRLLRADRSPLPSPAQRREPGSLGFLISPVGSRRRCGRGAPAIHRSWGMGLQVGVRAPPSPDPRVVPGRVAFLCRRERL